MGHTPGRGHRRKSDPNATKKFRKKAALKKSQAKKQFDKAVERWQSMTEEQRKFLPELDPENFS
jgi:hypothetical protein